MLAPCRGPASLFFFLARLLTVASLRVALPSPQVQRCVYRRRKSFRTASNVVRKVDSRNTMRRDLGGLSLARRDGVSNVEANPQSYVYSAPQCLVGCHMTFKLMQTHVAPHHAIPKGFPQISLRARRGPAEAHAVPAMQSMEMINHKPSVPTGLCHEVEQR